MQIVRWKAETATYVALLGGLAYLYWLTFFFGKSIVRGYPGAAFFPRLILYFTLAATLAALVVSLFGGFGERKAKRFEFEGRDFVLTIATIAGFIVALPVLGFEITSFALLLVLLGLRLNGWLTAVVAALATTAVFYVLFVLMLQVSLPLRFLPAYVSF